MAYALPSKHSQWNDSRLKWFNNCFMKFTTFRNLRVFLNFAAWFVIEKKIKRCWFLHCCVFCIFFVSLGLWVATLQIKIALRMWHGKETARSHAMLRITVFLCCIKEEKYETFIDFPAIFSDLFCKQKISLCLWGRTSTARYIRGKYQIVLVNLSNCFFVMRLLAFSLSQSSIRVFV